MNGLVKRRWRVALWTGVVLALAATAIVLPPLIGSSDTLAQSARYTSICTRCGVQTAEDFYLVLGMEVLRCEKVLGASNLTRARTAEECSHEHAFIGKSVWQMNNNFRTVRANVGEPRGWVYRGEKLPKHLAALATMRPTESIRYIEALSAEQQNAAVRTNAAHGPAL